MLLALLVLSGCVTSKAIQPPYTDRSLQYKKTSSAKTIKHYEFTDNSSLSQEDVPIINLMARQGNADA